MALYYLMLYRDCNDHLFAFRLDIGNSLLDSGTECWIVRFCKIVDQYQCYFSNHHDEIMQLWSTAILSPAFVRDERQQYAMEISTPSPRYASKTSASIMVIVHYVSYSSHRGTLIPFMACYLAACAKSPSRFPCPCAHWWSCHLRVHPVVCASAWALWRCSLSPDW